LISWEPPALGLIDFTATSANHNPEFKAVARPKPKIAPTGRADGARFWWIFGSSCLEIRGLSSSGGSGMGRKNLYGLPWGECEGQRLGTFLRGPLEELRLKSISQSYAPHYSRDSEEPSSAVPFGVLRTAPLAQSQNLVESVTALHIHSNPQPGLKASRLLLLIRPLGTRLLSRKRIATHHGRPRQPAATNFERIPI
jgi:hypothetical protein